MLFRLFRKPRRKSPARPVRFRPRLETLEDRYCPAGGLLDPTFGTGGLVNLPHTTNSGAIAVAVQPDGKVVVVEDIGRTTGGSGFDAITVQRLNRDGSLDTTFNKTGNLTILTGKADWPTSVALQPDGKILVGGGALSNNGSSNEFLIARVNPNGTLDSTFASKGLWVYSPGGPVQDLAVLTDPAHPGTVTGIVAAAARSTWPASSVSSSPTTPVAWPRSPPPAPWTRRSAAARATCWPTRPGVRKSSSTTWRSRP